MNTSRNSQRRVLLLGVGISCICLFLAGCGETPMDSSQFNETPEQAAARVLAVAEGFTREGKTRLAFAAYHQVIQKYPKTSPAKEAAGRIRQVRREAAKKSGHQHAHHAHGSKSG